LLFQSFDIERTWWCINTTDIPVVKVYVDKLSSARISQHIFCATLSADVNINYRLLIKVYYLSCTVRHIKIEIMHGSKLGIKYCHINGAISVNVAVNSRWIARRVWKYQKVILIRKSKKDKQHNGQAKKDKRTSNDLQKIHIVVIRADGGRVPSDFCPYFI
jgi:hypothetical protein